VNGSRQVRGLRSVDELPSARARLRELLAGRPVAVFSDFDGTLTPIVARPELAVLDEDMRATLARLAKNCVVGIISGRDLEDVKRHVHIDSIWLAGSHGMDVLAPDGTRHEFGLGQGARLTIAAAADALEKEVADVPGVWIEPKRYAVAAHFRQADDAWIPPIEATVDRVARTLGLRKTAGKRILELRPDVGWDKGRALLWILAQLGPDTGAVVPIYIGDDITDEDAFVALSGRGFGVVVADDDRATAADARVRNVNDVRALLDDLGSETP
jgi:trehalose-phosphatase